MPALPPERVDLGVSNLDAGVAGDVGDVGDVGVVGVVERVELRRLMVADADAVARAVAENLDHLRPWMPWADNESADARFQRRRLAEAELQWSRGADFGYGLFAGDEDDSRLLGAFGLTARRGPKTLEIGYWLRVDATGRGLATRAVAALTDIAAGRPGIERVLVYCDQANHASSAIPRRLGYRLDRIVAVPPEAPAETGSQLEWVIRPAEWREQHGLV